jgi:hypothetical protein
MKKNYYQTSEQYHQTKKGLSLSKSYLPKPLEEM